VQAAVAAKELRRWILWLGGSLIGASIFTALALAGVSDWFILPAIVIGPGVGGIALVVLALKSDTNGVASTIAGEELPAVAAAEAA